MSESKHTPEPWSIDQDGTIMANDPNDTYISGKITLGDCFSESNARRIVACVNAMAGMEDPENDMKKLDQDMRELTAENAALRAKLEKAVKELDETIEELDDFNAYVPAFFQEKHRHAERIEAHRAALAEIKVES